MLWPRTSIWVNEFRRCNPEEPTFHPIMRSYITNC